MIECNCKEHQVQINICHIIVKHFLENSLLK